MMPQRIGVEGRGGCLLQLEMAMVPATDQGCEIARAAALRHRGGNIAHRKADTPFAGLVGWRSMDDERIMQRHFARTQPDVDRRPLIHAADHLFAATQHVQPVAAVAMGQYLGMAAWNHLHAAIVGAAVAQRQPGRHRARCVEAPMRLVLMPGDMAGAMALLDDETAAPA